MNLIKSCNLRSLIRMPSVLKTEKIFHDIVLTNAP